MTNGLIRRALACAAACTVFVSWPTLAEHYYLDDANKTKPPENGSLPIIPHDFPRVLTHELMGGVNAEGYSKYDFITSHGWRFLRWRRSSSSISPDTEMLRHISGRAYQSFNFRACSISGGLAFESHHGKSQGGPAGRRLRHLRRALAVQGRHAAAAERRRERPRLLPSRTRRASGMAQYVVIYDAPAGPSSNAEHVRVYRGEFPTKTRSR